MTQTMRWYGPNDLLSLDELKQAGIKGIVTALHEVPVGEIWTVESILERKKLIEKHGLTWEVIESLPVHEDIKKRTGNYKQYIENYKVSLKNIATCGIKVVTYNFMPILDWVRTDHYFKNADGAFVLRYDPIKFAYFDLFQLQRKNAGEDYPNEIINSAKQLDTSLTEHEKENLFKSVLLGLPGSTQNFTPQIINDLLESYQHITNDLLRNNLIEFLNEITPIAEKNKICLAIHPDDPPFSVLGLPRVVSSKEDLAYIFEHVPQKANGLCYCTGSLGANPDNNLADIFEKFSDRIHFLHLRNVKKENNGVFMESDHLEGDVPMPAIVSKIIALMQKKQICLPMRPDHGYLHSAEIHKKYYAGYSLIGRLKGLAEIRGLELGLLEHLNSAQDKTE